MAILLAEILDIPLHAIHQMPVAYVGQGNSVERLKRVIYSARRYLSQRSAEEVDQACADIISLYHWFFEVQAEKIAVATQQQTSPLDTALHDYLNMDAYLEDAVQSLKLAYLSEVDVLNAILHEREGAVFNQIACVKTDFSNVEFFCALALYHASIAITKIEDIQKLQAPSASDLLEEVYDAVLEAQVAVDYARQLSLADAPEFSHFVQGYIKETQRSLMRKAHTTRYGVKYRQRQGKAIELYEKGTYRSRLDAALQLIEPIQAYSKTLNIPPLKLDSAQDTIYKWLSKHDKEKKN